MGFVLSKIKLTIRSFPNVAREIWAGNTEDSDLFVGGQTLSQRAFNDYDTAPVLALLSSDERNSCSCSFLSLRREESAF